MYPSGENPPHRPKPPRQNENQAGIKQKELPKAKTHSSVVAWVHILKNEWTGRLGGRYSTSDGSKLRCYCVAISGTLLERTIRQSLNVKRLNTKNKMLSVFFSRAYLLFVADDHLRQRFLNPRFIFFSTFLSCIPPT